MLSRWLSSSGHGKGNGPDGKPDTGDECPWTDPPCAPEPESGCDVASSQSLNPGVYSVAIDFCSDGVIFDCDGAIINGLTLNERNDVTITECNSSITLKNSNTNTLDSNKGMILLNNSNENMLINNNIPDNALIELQHSDLNIIDSNKGRIFFNNSIENILTNNNAINLEDEVEKSLITFLENETISGRLICDDSQLATRIR